jgi:alpha-tubulin suppressor-like RCC1 family protein
VWGLGDDQDGEVTGRQPPAPGEHRVFTKPVRISLPEPIVYIAAGFDHSVAVDRRGQVWSWGGTNHRSVIGAGELVQQADGSSFVRIANIPPVVAVWVGTQTFAEDVRGSVWSWGEINLVAMNGDVHSGSATPSVVSGLKDVKKMDVSTFFTASLESNGRVAISGVAPGATVFPRPDPRYGRYVQEPTEIKDIDGALDLSGGLDGLALVDKSGEVLFFSINPGTSPFKKINIGN